MMGEKGGSVANDTSFETSGGTGLRPKTFGRATALFFFSGALGLGYELVWIKKAALVVGASQIALSTVLTSFFLGIALGGYFVGKRLRSSRRSPLFIYGIFELIIGAFALAFPFLFSLLEQLYGALYPLAAGFGGGSSRFASVFSLPWCLCPRSLWEARFLSCWMDWLPRTAPSVHEPVFFTGSISWAQWPGSCVRPTSPFRRSG